MSHNLVSLKILLTLLASTRKNKSIFVIVDVLFVDIRHILHNCNSQWLPFEEYTKLFNYSIL